MMQLDDHGWLLGAQRQESPNQDARPRDNNVHLLVVHSISLPPGIFGGDDIIKLFTNTLDHKSHPYYKKLLGLRVSAHFLISRTGGITQFVSCARRAWHAGDSIWRQQRACNDFSLGVELEGTDNTPFEDAQYNRLAALASGLAAHYHPLAAAGHEHIAAERKTDPGPAFDWERFFHLTQGAIEDGR